MKKRIVISVVLFFVFTIIYSISAKASTSVLYIYDSSSVNGENIKKVVENISNNEISVTTEPIGANMSFSQVATNISKSNYSSIIIQDSYTHIMNSKSDIISGINVLKSKLNEGSSCEYYVGASWKDLTSSEKTEVLKRMKDVENQSTDIVGVYAIYDNLFSAKNKSIGVLNGEKLTTSGELLVACSYYRSITGKRIENLTSYTGISDNDVSSIVEIVNNGEFNGASEMEDIDDAEYLSQNSFDSNTRGATKTTTIKKTTKKTTKSKAKKSSKKKKTTKVSDWNFIVSTKISIKKGNSLTIIASDAPAGTTFTWKSNNRTIATIVRDGSVQKQAKLTGIKKGTTTLVVTGKYKGKTRTKKISVTVNDKKTTGTNREDKKKQSKKKTKYPPPTTRKEDNWNFDIITENNRSSVFVGEKLKVRVIVRSDSIIIPDSIYSWNSSQNLIAEVNCQEGNTKEAWITGKKKGGTTITVKGMTTDSQKTKSLYITVNDCWGLNGVKNIKIHRRR